MSAGSDAAISQLYGPPAPGQSGSKVLDDTAQSVTVPAQRTIMLSAYEGDAFYGLADTTQAENQTLLMAGQSVAFRVEYESTIYLTEGPAAGGTVYYSILGG